MMRFLQPVALTLTIMLILVMGLMELSMASHAIDHQHHSAQTHTTGICAWMCAAAHTISTDSQIFAPHVTRLEIVQSSPFSSIISHTQLFLPARAPPF